MKYRRGIFFVVYKNLGGRVKKKYLILERKLHWKGWEFPKAGLKNHENREKALERELKEETGCKPKKIKKFNINGKFKYKKKMPDRKGYAGQSWRLFAVEVDCKKIKIEKKEHRSYKWLDFKSAMKILTYPNQKRCLKIVNSKI
jgi:8-oxo-dGTP pyrophosphatase MutT (NUDIX family)